MQGSTWKILFLALECALLFLFVHGILIASSAPYLDPANVQCQGELVCTTSTLRNVIQCVHVGLCGGKRGVGKDQYFKTERQRLLSVFPFFFFKYHLFLFQNCRTAVDLIWIPKLDDS